MKRTQELLKQATADDADVEPILEAICRDAAENFDADLVSIWLFEQGPERIECQLALDVTADATSSGQVLLKSNYPVYFRSILEQSTISAPVAATHSMTHEFAESCFKPNGIISLLDFIVHRDFNPVGVTCCENRSARRDWSEDNQRYLMRLATLASFKTRS